MIFQDANFQILNQSYLQVDTLNTEKANNQILDGAQIDASNPAPDSRDEPVDNDKDNPHNEERVRWAQSQP